MIQAVTRLPYVPTTKSGTTATPAATAAEPVGSGFHIQGFGDNLSLGSSLATLYNSGKTAMDGASQLGGDASQVVNGIKGVSGGDLFNGLEGLAKGAVPLAKRSAIFEGAVSVVTNGYKLATGRENVATFGSNVVGDTLSGAAGGFGGAIAGAIGTAALGALGVSGGLLTLGSIAVGMVGYSLTEKLFRNTNIFHSITNTVHQALSGL
ncbi:MAG TPA: hypothetical protein V6D47_08855 [Oscillatoriaceae cyanobacterium]